MYYVFHNGKLLGSWTTYPEDVIREMSGSLDNQNLFKDGKATFTILHADSVRTIIVFDTTRGGTK